jgi:hypothetical protein
MNETHEVLALMDELDDLIAHAKIVPLTGQVRVDREKVYALLDRMRTAYPKTIAAARAGRLPPLETR